MLLIPAIDLKDGKCVRLKQGDMNEETIYSENPSDVADRWISAGARRLHIVDLNGASSGKPVNADIIHEIVEKHPDIPVQVGGGIRDEDRSTAHEALAAAAEASARRMEPVEDELDPRSNALEVPNFMRSTHSLDHRSRGATHSFKSRSASTP